MFYRAVSRVQCGPVPGDKWKRKMEVVVASGPLVPEERRAELLRKVFEQQRPANINTTQRVIYD